MATKTQIQKALTLAYDRVLFAKDVLRPVFGSAFTLLDTPSKTNIPLTKSESRVINKVGIYAHAELDDATNITFYEVTLQPQVRIEQSKVAIQQFVRKILIPGQAALINFISPRDQDTWRFTLVAKDSKISSKGVEEIQTHPQRYTYLVEKSHSNRTMAERLEGLSILPSINLETLISAFSVESMSEDFFREYKEQYQSFVQYLTGKRMVKEKGKWTEKVVNNPSPFLASFFNGNEKNARDFIKKLMGRIIFLYFVQKKRWLGASTKAYQDGSVDFISRLFSETGGDERFFPLGLSPLFFSALNTQRANDDWEMPSGRVVKVPYLNGGLFIRDEIDEIIHKRGDLLTFPPHLFSDLDKEEIPNRRGFLDFLNAFNFTVYEDSQYEHTVAVDPEMLGHIFENLLEDNKDKGAFYTPKEIVHYMCQESLIEYLTTHLSKEYKVYRKIGNNQFEVFGNEASIGQLAMVETLGEKALDRNDVENIVKEKNIQNLSDAQLDKIDGLLDVVKICDPAIGSGAFPMGLLQEIFTIKEAIASFRECNFEPARVKENIIQNSIYGVDIEKGAVDIARLRFWLSLVVDEELPRALPNLDYKIVVGDSLVSKFENIPIEVDWNRGFSVGKADEHLQELKLDLILLTEKQKLFFDPKSENKAKLKEEIRDLKIGLLENQLLINKEIFLAKTPVHGGFSPSSVDKKRNLERDITVSGFNKTLKALERLKMQPSKSFDHFDWKLDFPDVMNPVISGENPGFDIIIENPPYVEFKNLAEEVKENLNSYVTAKGKYDLFIPFIELTSRIAKKNGQITCICPTRFMHRNYGKELRQFIDKNYQMIRIADFGDKQMFSTAMTYTGVFLLKYKQISEYKFQYQNNLDNWTAQNFDKKILSERVWYFNDDVNSVIVDKLRIDTIPLSDLVEGIYQGISTGKDEVFVVNEETLVRNGIEKEIAQPFLKGKDIGPYGLHWSGNYCIYPYDVDGQVIIEEELKQSYPNTYRYLIANRSLLEGRGYFDKSRKKWYELWNQRNLRRFLQKKLITLDNASTNSFTLDSVGYIGTTTTYSLIPKADLVSLEYLLGVLNSKLLTYYHKRNTIPQAGGFFRYQATFIKDLPIRICDLKTQNIVGNLVNRILFSKTQDLSDLSDKLIFKYFLDVIDGIVFEIYFPELMDKYDRHIIRYLGSLSEKQSRMPDVEMIADCREVFNELYDKKHPIRNHLFYLDSIPEFSIIAGKNENN